MTENDSKKSSILESPKLLAVVIIVAATAISVAYVTQFGDVYILAFDKTIGVGPEDESQHVHGRLKVYIIDRLIDFDPTHYPKFAFASDYIFLDENKNIHRTAGGATLAMLLDGLGITYTDSCLILNDDFYQRGGFHFEKKAYCNDFNNVVRLYIDKELLREGGANYVLKDKDKVMIGFTDRDKILGK